jgi:hypothetical protein
VQTVRNWLLILPLVLAGCGSESASIGSVGSSPEISVTEDQGESATAKEEVGYYNPKTGYKSDYDLDVDHNSDGTVDRINFDNGGYIGSHHITHQEDNGDGTVTVHTDKGQQFTVDKEGE